jgi:type II secretory ATPase GspE/PulE/Tfp pilus assembly ATPase PilB-like protein
MIEKTIAYTDMTRRMSNKKLGDLLIEHKLITANELEKALETQRQESCMLGEVLVKQGLLKDEELLEILSGQLKVPIVDLKGRIIKREVLDLVPESMARSRNIIPVEVVGNKLVLVMGHPEDLLTIDDISLITGKQVYIALGAPLDIEQAINFNYENSNELDIQIGEIQNTSELEPEPDIQISEFSPTVQNLNKIIEQAVQERASDIHIEPHKKRVRVRFRIDGILQDKYSLPISANAFLMSRLKILSKMNIAENRRPQDGQLSMKVGKRNIDIRVATIGTSHGERATLRILDKSLSLLTLDQLGFSPSIQAQLESMLKSSFGIILSGGPTGSGKTTTLYAMINHLNRHELNIMTIEDPIEYNFPDISQMQINEKAGITFSNSLRATLRHDPDVILVGEIRDPDTAKIAVQAALTGHLVLASIHASDVASMIFRLIHLGIEPYLISSSLIGLLAQRLIRCVCPYCSKPTALSLEEKKAYHNVTGEELSIVNSGKGCSLCSNTGYHGRTGIFELLYMNDTIRGKLMDGSNASEIRQEAINQGMIALAQSGMMKAKLGIASVSEVLRAIHPVGL